MDIKITPASLCGSVSSMPSKSVLHRLLICSALSDKSTEIAFASLSDDICATMSCVEAMGGKTEFKNGKIYVTPIWKNFCGESVFDCRESGSTLRFFMPLAAVLCTHSEFYGKGRLFNRPLSPLIEEMTKNGAVITQKSSSLEICGKMNGGIYEIPGNISSQFISGLLFALPLATDDSKIIITSQLSSVSYIDMTIDALKSFGIKISRYHNVIMIYGRQKYISPGYICAEGDWSNAAFWLCAGTINGDITVRNLDMMSHQGDKEIISVLRSFGAEIEINDNSFNTKKSQLSAIKINCDNIPDLVPVIAAVASVSDGVTYITGIERLKLKESNRIEAVCHIISSLGGDIVYENETLIINGKEQLCGGYVQSFGDHRIVMAAAVCALKCSGDVIIHGAEAVNKSYPDFFKDYQALGGDIHVI